ncbi:MAG: toll/interleukin-1 receptor domain-containing protein [Hydrogenophilaceae bacterium]|nr:toll/interleukin-1 receptor domain-containing protein [Hydrogenophilaceae bacterium]
MTTMTGNALRAIGPRTFISYSFSDTALASVIRDDLTGAGFQVQMEDETSLINTKLDDVLAERVRGAECFIQLRTPDSNSSHWVERELDFAEGRHGGKDGFVLLPIVTDKRTISERLRKWVYIDASRGDLSPKLMEVVRNAALKSVCTVPVDPRSPCVLSTKELGEALKTPGDERRVILDSNGHWLDWHDEVLAWASGKDSPQAASFYERETRRRPEIVWRLELADAALRIVLRNLHASLGQGTIRREQAQAIATAFYRILIALVLRPTLENRMAIDAKKSRDDSDIRELLKIETVGPSDHETAEMRWALQPIMKERFRGFRTPGGDTLVKTGLAASEGKVDSYVHFPAAAIGADWRETLSMVPTRTCCGR